MMRMMIVMSMMRVMMDDAYDDSNESNEGCCV